MKNETPQFEEAEVIESTPQPTVESKTNFLWGGIFPSIVDLLAILGIFLVAQLISLALTYALGYSLNWSALESSQESARLIAQGQAGLFSLVSYSITMTITIIGALVIRKIRGGKAPLARFSLVGFNPSVLLWGVLLLFSVAIIFDPLMSFLPPAPKIYGRGWPMIVALVVIAPITEEFLCRGIVLEALRARRGVWAACIISSIFFSVLHFHPTSSVNALIIGVVLAYLYIRTNSLFAPIILHAFNNGLAFLLLWFGYENITLWEIVGNKTIYAIIYGVALLTLAISLVSIVRQLSAIKQAQEMRSEEAKSEGSEGADVKDEDVKSEEEDTKAESI